MTYKLKRDSEGLIQKGIRNCAADFCIYAMVMSCLYGLSHMNGHI